MRYITLYAVTRPVVFLDGVRIEPTPESTSATEVWWPLGGVYEVLIGGDHRTGYTRSGGFEIWGMKYYNQWLSTCDGVVVRESEMILLQVISTYDYSIKMLLISAAHHDQIVCFSHNFETIQAPHMHHD